MGKKILFFQRSFIPFFKLHLCYLIKAKMAACQLPGLQLQRQGRLKHARVSVCVCVCVCMCFIKSWTVKATTLDLLMDICFTLVLCVHAHTPIGTLICLFRSSGAPHDADVVNSGMEWWVDVKGPVTQSLPNLITDSFARSSWLADEGHQRKDRWPMVVNSCG